MQEEISQNRSSSPYTQKVAVKN